jgi:hypothetical protein
VYARRNSLPFFPFDFDDGQAPVKWEDVHVPKNYALSFSVPTIPLYYIFSMEISVPFSFSLVAMHVRVARIFKIIPLYAIC